MRFNRGPEGPSFGYEESGSSNMEHLDSMRRLAGQVEAAAYKLGAEQIAEDPTLHAMLSKVVESGPELDPTHTDQIRKTIGQIMCGLPDIAAQAATDQEFYGLAVETIHDEIETLKTIPGAEDLRDM